MLLTLENHTKTPNNREFLPKIIQFERFDVEYTENSRHSMRFSRKIGEIAIFGIKLIPNLTIRVENSKKSEFSVKQV